MTFGFNLISCVIFYKFRPSFSGKRNLEEETIGEETEFIDINRIDVE